MASSLMVFFVALAFTWHSSFSVRVQEDDEQAKEIEHEAEKHVELEDNVDCHRLYLLKRNIRRKLKNATLASATEMMANAGVTGLNATEAARRVDGMIEGMIAGWNTRNEDNIEIPSGGDREALVGKLSSGLALLKNFYDECPEDPNSTFKLRKHYNDISFTTAVGTPSLQVLALGDPSNCLQKYEEVEQREEDLNMYCQPECACSITEQLLMMALERIQQERKESEFEARMRAIGGKMETYQKESKALNDEFSALVATANDIKAQANLHKAEIQRLIAEGGETQAKARTILAKIDTLKTKADDIKAAIAQNEEQIKSLQANLGKADGMTGVAVAAVQINTWKSKVAELKAEKKRLLEEQRAMRAEMEAKNDAYDACKESYAKKGMGDMVQVTMCSGCLGSGGPEKCPLAT